MNLIKQHHRVIIDGKSSVHAFTLEPEKPLRTPVIFSHGFSVDGAESYRLFVTLAQHLALKGHPCILFDYRGSGYSDLDFCEMTIDSEVLDLEHIIAFAKQHFRSSSVIVFGMSLGCAVAALVAGPRKDIKGLVLWCLSSNLYERYSKRLGPEIHINGYIYIDKGFKVGLPFLQSLKDKDVPLSIQHAKTATLLVHGDADDVAPVELSRHVKKVYPVARLHEIKGGNHGFKLQNEQREEAIRATSAWLAGLDMDT
jgi:pimeloyl-ACP methyl ester carboxylesterase